MDESDLKVDVVYLVNKELARYVGREINYEGLGEFFVFSSMKDGERIIIQPDELFSAVAEA